MAFPRPWFEVTIAGFVYTISIIFFLLTIARWLNFYSDKKFIDFIQKIHNYLPYIALALVFTSFVIGYSAYLVSENIIFSFCKVFKDNGYELSKILSRIPAPPEQLLNSHNTRYSEFIMFRHLFISTFLLGISLICYYWKTNNWKQKLFIIIVCSFFALTFLWSYIAMKGVIRNSDKQVREVINGSINKPF